MTAGEEKHRDERAQWFGDNVRQRREERGMSQHDVATKMTERGWPWHQSTVYKTEHGTRRTEAFELHDLAEILGIPIANLFWPPAEVGEEAIVREAIGMVRTSWEKAAMAAYRLLADIAWGERTLGQHAGSKYERVHEMRAELEAELAERTLDTAIDEGEYRYEHRGDES